MGDRAFVNPILECTFSLSAPHLVQNILIATGIYVRTAIKTITHFTRLKTARDAKYKNENFKLKLT